MQRKRQTTTQNAKTTLPKPRRDKATFMEHLAELRRRLFFIILSVAVGSAAAYGVEHQIIDILLKPAHGQEFIYTSPIGGMNFLIKVCIYAGIMVSIPVIVYQFLRYIEPLMRRESSRFIRYGSLASGLLAVAGIVFGYFVGLPAALHFLLNQFITSQIQPLLTIEAYLSFVTVYMLGAALMFQIPLLVLFINRITPLKPQQLFKYERWVILFSVVLALIMNPTPRLLDQLFVAGPMILSYQLSITIVWLYNRRHTHVTSLRDTDAQIRAERLRRAHDLQAAWQLADTVAVEAESAPVNQKTVENAALPPQPRIDTAGTRYTRRPIQPMRRRPMGSRYNIQ